MSNPVGRSEKQTLLLIAREALIEAAHGKSPDPLELHTLSRPLQDEGASFVTLTINGQLRGCIGSIEPVEPLAADVQRHAVDAALSDPRFPPVQVEELEQIMIEISILTRPAPLLCQDHRERSSCLQPGVDGVLIRSGMQRATFLPQVWEKLPEPEVFLDFLCQKANLPAGAWKLPDVELLTYRVTHFNEEFLNTASG